MSLSKLSDLQAYQSPWLKASDLQGRAVTVVVEKATVEDIRQQNGQKEARIVVTFRGKAKRLICNKTQAMTLADLAKTEVFADWRGLSVVLAPAKTRSGQETIEIRPAAKTLATDQDDDLAGAMPPMKRQGDNPFDDNPPEFAG